MPKKSARKPVQRTLSATPPPPKPKNRVTFSHSGHMQVHGPKGDRIAELEKPWPILWAEHAESLGVDPEGYVFQLPGAEPVKIIRQLDGLTWKIGK